MRGMILGRDRQHQTRTAAPGTRAAGDRSSAGCEGRGDVTEQYANNRIEADHGRLKARLRPMRGLKQFRSAARLAAGHASCRTSAAVITNWPPTSRPRSAWQKHSTSSRWPCDLRFSAPDACPSTLDATDPRWCRFSRQVNRLAVLMIMALSPDDTGNEPAAAAQQRPLDVSVGALTLLRRRRRRGAGRPCGSRRWFRRLASSPAPGSGRIGCRRS